MGGKVAMATALLHPSRVSALCVIDIAPVRYSVADGSDWRLADAMVRELAKLPLDELSSKRDADARLSRTIVDPAMRAFALTNLLEEPCVVNLGQKTLTWKINLAVIEKQLRVVAGADLPGAVRPFKGPTLFVKGGASRCVEMEVSTTIAVLCFHSIAHASRFVCILGLRRLQSLAYLEPIDSLLVFISPCVAFARYVDEVLHLGPGIKAGLFPDLSVETIPGAGHWVHVTNPNELHAAVAALIRRKPRLI
jgi:pimeloyl-ACP methyl ester carboxylesterase